MISVLSLAAAAAGLHGVPSLRSFMTSLAGSPASLRAAFATHALNKGYLRRRGFSSHLGLPLHGGQSQDKVVATAAGAGHIAQFRSGVLLLSGALDGEPEAKDTHEASVELVALECRNKQEKTDEVVGSVGCVRPSDKTSTITSIAKVTMGGEGERIVQFSDIVYQGAFANVAISCSLIEKDSGDTTKYREAFAKEIQKAAAVGASAAGVSSEALAGGEDWMRQVSLGLSNVVFDVLGADDDQFNPQTFKITWEEMLARKEGRLEVKTLRRDDDSHEVPYTHRMLVSGTDDGGDTGEYGFYFMVRTRPRPEVPEDFL